MRARFCIIACVASWVPSTERSNEKEEQEIIPDPKKSTRNLHFKTLPFILVVATFAPLGNVLFSKGMKGFSAATSWQAAEILQILLHILNSGYIWLGIASAFTSFVAYMLVLTWADYSYIQPAASISYVVVATLSHFFLGEAVPPLRWLGIALICAGVFVVGHTHPRTTASESRA